MVHLKVYDIDGAFLWEADYKQVPNVGLTFKKWGRIMQVLEINGDCVTVMEREN